MATYNNTNKAEITQARLDELNRLFDLETVEEGGKEGMVEGYAFEFENKNTIYFDIMRGGNNYWDNCFMTDENGNEIDVFDCSYRIDETMEFHTDDDKYIIKFDIK